MSYKSNCDKNYRETQSIKAGLLGCQRLYTVPEWREKYRLEKGKKKQRRIAERQVNKEKQIKGKLKAENESSKGGGEERQEW